MSEDTSLPQGWEKWRCHSSSFYYYYNRTTKCSQWERPGQVTMRQFMEVMEQAMKRKDWRMRTVVDDLQMLQDFANGTRTLPEEITESRGVWRLFGPISMRPRSYRWVFWVLLRILVTRGFC
uniref:WW domain-containing protein n=1 Tax=Eptatretus burgeri TaxID=7764 RepID=A0A8C4RF66_EPTBU